MSARFSPGPEPPARLGETPLWCLFQDDLVLVRWEARDPELPRLRRPEELGLEPRASHYLGRLGSRPVFAAAVERGAPAPGGYQWQGQRQLFMQLEAESARAVGVGRQVLAWDLHNRFCGACGEVMVTRPGERARQCPACGLLRYPRLSPAVIVGVRRGRRILLTRSPYFPPGRYGVLAGFVEPGETAEEAVRREVREETGIRVQRIRYFGSQPWPFPDSLMIAFTAEYAGGRLEVDHRELEDAGWFGPERLPELPGPETVARRLIDHVLGLPPAG